MTFQDERSTGVGERRKSNRRDSDVHLEVEVESRTIEGRAENISSAGVFFFADGPLQVNVKIVQDGHSQTYTGKLVRVERLSPETTGFAIEFDRL
jgi:hypothetical protein